MDFQARQILARMNRMEIEIQDFARHARLLQQTGGVDARDLLIEAGRLMRNLGSTVEQLRGAAGQGRSLMPFLSSRPPTSSGVGRYSYSGPPPRAVWGAELRAAEKRCQMAIMEADRAIRRLHFFSMTGMNNPLRTSTGAPESAFEVMVTFIEMLAKLLESGEKKDKKS